MTGVTVTPPLPLVTVRATVAVCESVPLVPVIVTVDEPAAAEVEAVNVAVSPLKLTVTPVGRPLAVKVTVPVKPPVGVTVIVLVPVPPTVTLAAVAESEKLAVGFTVRVNVAV
jgi:hypothetical protein